MTRPANLISQTFTYMLNPINDQESSTSGSSQASGIATTAFERASGFQVQIVMELCDRGSLRGELDKQGANAFRTQEGDLYFAAVLQTVADIAKGIAQLHRLNIVHSDCKVNSILDTMIHALMALFWYHLLQIAFSD